MDEVIDNNYRLLIKDLDPEILAPHLKSHLTVGGSSRYWQTVRNPEKTRRPQTEDLLKIIRNKKDILFWEEFAAICRNCGFTDIAQIFYDGIKDVKRRHLFPPRNRKPFPQKAVREVQFKGSRTNFQNVLDHNLPQLLEMIDPDILIPCLKPQLTVGGDDFYYELVTKPKIPCVRNEKLLDIIRQREDMWKPFLDACKSCGYQDILEMFQEVFFDKEEPKKNGKKWFSSRSKPRPESKSLKPETDSLSSEEDQKTLYGCRTSLRPRTTSVYGSGHQSSNIEGTNQAPRVNTGIVGDLLVDRNYTSMPSGKQEVDKQREDQNMEDNEGAVLTNHSEQRLRKAEFVGNRDVIVKHQPERKEIPTVNMPNLEQIMPSDSSLTSEANDQEQSDVGTDKLFGPGQTEEVPDEKNGKESDATVYCSTLPSSMFEDSPNTLKDWTGQGYSLAFLRSECSDTSTDAEQLREDLLRKQEESSKKRNGLDHGNQQFNQEHNEPYNEDQNQNHSKGPKELLPNNDRKDADKNWNCEQDHGPDNNDAGVSDVTFATKNDDNQQLTVGEGLPGTVDLELEQIGNTRGEDAQSYPFGQNQNGGHLEIRPDLRDDNDNASKEYTNTPDSGQQCSLSELASLLEVNNNSASGKCTDQIREATSDENEQEQEHNGACTELTRNVENNNGRVSKKLTAQEGEISYDTVQASHPETRTDLEDDNCSGSRENADQSKEVIPDSVLNGCVQELTTNFDDNKTASKKPTESTDLVEPRHDPQGADPELARNLIDVGALRNPTDQDGGLTYDSIQCGQNEHGSHSEIMIEDNKDRASMKLADQEDGITYEYDSGHASPLEMRTRLENNNGTTSKEQTDQNGECISVNQEQNGGNPELARNLGDNKLSAPKTQANQNGECTSFEQRQEQNGGDPEVARNLEDNNLRASEILANQNGECTSSVQRPEQNGGNPEVERNLKDNILRASEILANQNEECTSSEQGPEQNGGNPEVARNLGDNNLRASEILANQNGKVLGESGQTDNGSPASRSFGLYHSIPILLEALKCTDVTNFFSLPLFHSTDKSNKKHSHQTSTK